MFHVCFHCFTVHIKGTLKILVFFNYTEVFKSSLKFTVESSQIIFVTLKLFFHHRGYLIQPREVRQIILNKLIRE